MTVFISFVSYRYYMGIDAYKDRYYKVNWLNIGNHISLFVALGNLCLNTIGKIPKITITVVRSHFNYTYSYIHCNKIFKEKSICKSRNRIYCKQKIPIRVDVMSINSIVKIYISCKLEIRSSKCNKDRSKEDWVFIVNWYKKSNIFQHMIMWM